jgi:hypothetical protein
MIFGGYYPGFKADGAGYSLHSNALSYSSTYLYVFIARYLMKHRDNSTFYTGGIRGDIRTVMFGCDIAAFMTVVM